EKRLIKRLGEFPSVVAETASRRAPHRLVHYAHDVASDVSKFYRDCRVTGDDVPELLTTRRLAICDAARQVLATSLDLVGVHAMERMPERV
ncbi:MAG: arginine--tRNA ligase, partial [Thermoleophilia bacterium]|nr:arginine--tRNA ligase [Thermoleophilia bacterium]